MEAPHILLITHRRSGTHLTIDLLRNNFQDYSQPYISINEIMKRNDEVYTTKFAKRMGKTPRIFKSHSDINYQAFHKQPALVDLYRELVNNSKLIYVYREPKDTLTSLFFHYKKYRQDYANMKIDEFVISENDYHTDSYFTKLNRVEYWKYHIEGWLKFKGNILFIAFEEIISDFENVILRIGKFINSNPKSTLVDIRLNDNSIPIEKNNKPIVDNNIHFTTENFRGGEIGSYKNNLSIETIRKIDESTKYFYDSLIRKT